MKVAGNICPICGSEKDTKTNKFEVHHKYKPNWQRIFDAVYNELLCEPEKMIVMCKKCHEGEHAKTNTDR